MTTSGNTSTLLPIEWLDLDVESDWTECESLHLVTECSYTVTHRLHSCTPAHLICQNAADYNKRFIALHSYSKLCAECHRPAFECWRVVPV